MENKARCNLPHLHCSQLRRGPPLKIHLGICSFFWRGKESHHIGHSHLLAKVKTVSCLWNVHNCTTELKQTFVGRVLLEGASKSRSLWVGRIKLICSFFQQHSPVVLATEGDIGSRSLELARCRSSKPPLLLSLGKALISW